MTPGSASRALALGGLLVALACAVPHAGPVPGPERKRADLSPDDIAAVAEALRLEDHRRFEPDAFERLVGHGSVEVRRRAVTAAGRSGDAAAAPMLVRVLQRETHPDVRADAAFALGVLGDTSGAVIRALRTAAPERWVPAGEAGTVLAVEVIGALTRLGTDAAAEHVLEAIRLARPGTDARSARIAAHALLSVWRFPSGSDRVGAILPFIASADPELRWRAAYALMRLGEADGAPGLLGALRDPDPRVRAYAARGLSPAVSGPAGVGDSAVLALTALLSDPHPHVRINAIGSLAAYGDRAPVPAMAALLGDGDPNVTVAAATALSRLGARAAGALDSAGADTAVHLTARGIATAGLAGSRPGSAWPRIERWAVGTQAERYAAARATPVFGWERAAPVLVRLATDPDDRVAIAALQAVAAIIADTVGGAVGGAVGGRPTDEAANAGATRLLLEVAAGDDLRRATVALAGIGPVLAAGDVDAVMDAYAGAAAATERARDVPGRAAARAAAIAAARTLGAASRRDAFSPARFFARFESHPDPWIRRAVAEAFGAGLEGVGAVALAGDIAVYRDIVERHIAAPLRGEAPPRVEIGTTAGTITLELAASEAPLTVHNFLTLAASGYYDRGVWHRVVPNFVLQDGAPGGYAGGGPGWTIRDEINRLRYERGTLGMAHYGPDTGGGQWFIAHSPQPHLDGGYTIFGRVVGGMEAADRVVEGDPVEWVRVAQ